MTKYDPVEKYCSQIQILLEGGSKITEPRAGITSDMKGRWTIGAFQHDKQGEKETPSLKEMIWDNMAGTMQMVQFYNKASEDQISELNKLLDLGKLKDALVLMQKVLGVKFKGDLATDDT